MPIVESGSTGERGKKDAKRHRDKQRKVIKERLPDIISEENIITEKKGKKVRVPIRGVTIPDFRPGTRRKDPGDGNGDNGKGGGIGVGQGPGKPGDVIGKRPGQGQEPGGAGEEPGQDYIETEIEIEELIEMMFEDLGLPNLEEKDVAQLEVILGYELSGIRKSGPWVLLDNKRTGKEGMGRFFAYMEILKSETDRDELVCFEALNQSDGNLADALELLKDPNLTATVDEIEPFPIFEDDDMRFHNFRERVSHESNAVIIAMMDVSGSMTTMKKYLARSLLFWLSEFLRKVYDNVEIRFIIHHTEAKLVDEHTFFHTGESGGTKCVSAYELARELISNEYPTNMWNVYPFHFSDGDDWNVEPTIREARKMIEEDGVNMFGYGEIRVDEFFSGRSSTLYPAFKEAMPVQQQKKHGMSLLVGKQEYPFVGIVIEKKEQIWDAIQQFLKKDRWLQ